jgi:hypothetical protein
MKSNIYNAKNSRIQILDGPPGFVKLTSRLVFMLLLPAVESKLAAWAVASTAALLLLL